MTEASKEIYLTNTVSWSGKQLASDIGGEVILMNIEVGRYYGLDDIGSRIWRSIEQPIVVEQLCQSMAMQYKADIEVVTSDVLTLLNRLLEQQLITVADA
jgi:hypothetical protein